MNYILPSLLCGTAQYMINSIIVPDETFEVKFLIYGALIANTSTRKTAAQNLTKDAVYRIEKEHGNDYRSKIANGCTIEGIIELLSKESRLISFYDEAG